MTNSKENFDGAAKGEEPSEPQILPFKKKSAPRRSAKTSFSQSVPGRATPVAHMNLNLGMIYLEGDRLFLDVVSEEDLNQIMKSLEQFTAYLKDVRDDHGRKVTLGNGANAEENEQQLKHLLSCVAAEMTGLPHSDPHGRPFLEEIPPSLRVMEAERAPFPRVH